MTVIEAKIIRRDINEENQVQALTGRIGGVVFQARGIGTYHENTQFPSLGFPGRWASGKTPEITPQENIRFLAEQVASSIADTSKVRGFIGYVHTVHLGSASAPIGIENEVRKVLMTKYKLEVGSIVRDSLACNGTVWALTQEAGKQTQIDRRIIVATFEHTSPFTAHSENKYLPELFGDGIGVIAFTSKDLSVQATNTLFDQDKHSVLTLPHDRVGTLAPESERTPFKNYDGRCIVKGDEGSVFIHHGGIHQPLPQSPRDVATMNGKSLLIYFGNHAPLIMKETLNDYARRIGRGHVENELNPYGVIHQPSQPVFEPVANRFIDLTKSSLKHEWTPSLKTSTLHHNNVSGATTIFSLLAMIEAGLITQSDIIFTGMGVGHNMTSTIFRFNELSRADRVRAKVHLPHLRK